MSEKIPGFLLDWARLSGPAIVLAEARRRLESGKLGVRARLDLPLTPGERAQVGKLLPPTWAASSNPLRVADLRAALADNGVTLEALLVAVGGPLRDLPAERAVARAATRTNHEAGVQILASILDVLTGHSVETAADSGRASPDSGNSETGIASPSRLAPHEPAASALDVKTRAQLRRILRGYPNWVETAVQVKAVVDTALAGKPFHTAGIVPIAGQDSVTASYVVLATESNRLTGLTGQTSETVRDAVPDASARISSATATTTEPELSSAATSAMTNPSRGSFRPSSTIHSPTSAIRLPVLAAQLWGDAHALDRDTPLGRACARVLALASALREAGAASVSAGEAGEADKRDKTSKTSEASEIVTRRMTRAIGEPDGTGEANNGAQYVDPLGEAEVWRAAWASIGVECDEVSAQVLVLNLPLEGTAPAVAVASAAPGEPTWLTLRSLRGELRLAPGVAEVFVCENPSIIEAAADAFGACSKPLVCTFGFPNQATLTLLAALAESGTRLRVRADADAAGWNIVKQLMQFRGTERWRMPEGQRGYEEEFIADLLSDLDPADI